MVKSSKLPFAEFGTKLRAYRLQAGIATQRELTSRLADLGMDYDYTVVSHWEKGRRCPTLETLVALIQVLVEARGIENVAAANRLLQLANMRNLRDDEVIQIFGDLPSGTEETKESSTVSAISQINTDLPPIKVSVP